MNAVQRDGQLSRRRRTIMSDLQDGRSDDDDNDDDIKR